jgi:excisionase family DNA binding protein
MTKLLVDPATGAEMLGVSRATFYIWLRSGHIRSLTLGRSRRVEVAELHAFIARQREAKGEVGAGTAE